MVRALGALRRLVESLPEATLAAPLGATGNALWFAEVCRSGAAGRSMTLFSLDWTEVGAFVERPKTQRRIAAPIGVLRRTRTLHRHRAT